VPRALPFEPARDLLGISAAIWAEEKGLPFPSTLRLQKIERLARELTGAMASAEQHDPGTTPYERALSRPDGAAFRVADVVEVYATLEPVLKAASARVRGKTSKGTERERRWAMGKTRG